MSTHDQTHAIVLDPDGTYQLYDHCAVAGAGQRTSAVRRPTEAWLAWAHVQLGGDKVDVATCYDGQLVAICPDLAYGDYPWAYGRPRHFNWRATALYGRSPLYGRIVIYRDDHNPIDQALVTALGRSKADLVEHIVRTHPQAPTDEPTILTHVGRTCTILNDYGAER